MGMELSDLMDDILIVTEIIKPVLRETAYDAVSTADSWSCVSRNQTEEIDEILREIIRLTDEWILDILSLVVFFGSSLLFLMKSGCSLWEDSVVFCLGMSVKSGVA